MHQRKTNDFSNGNSSSSSTAIAYGNSDNNRSNEGGGGGSIHGSSNQRQQQQQHQQQQQQQHRMRTRKRGRKRIGTQSAAAFVFEFPAKQLLLPLLVLIPMILFGFLWIRMLWKIGSMSAPSQHPIATEHKDHHHHHHHHRRQQEQQKENDSNNNRPLFRLESEDAPSCRDKDTNLDALKSPNDIDVTLVTQLSDDRLWMMKHHCERYGPHAVSIAVYSNATRDDILDRLGSMGCRITRTTNTKTNTKTNTDDAQNHHDGNSNNGLAAGALLSVTVLDARSHGAWNDYPVNQLRNLALGGVHTSHVAYIDVDFWPSEGLYESISTTAVKQKLWQDPKLALVLPAFQLQRSADCRDETRDCREEHVPRMPKTLSELVTQFRHKNVTTFDPFNQGGHGSTDYKHWFMHQNNEQQQRQHHLYEIPCLKSHRYEPFLVIRYCKEITPPFQAAFSGYGKNKMTWTMQVAASGFLFAQVGGSYLVHYPHAISKSREHWNRAPKELQQQQQQQHDNQHKNNYNVRKPKKSDGNLGFENYHRGQVDDLYLRFKEWLHETIPKDQARISMCKNTAQDDDSKLWVDPDRKQGWKTNEGKK